MKNILILFFVLITLNLSAQSLFKSYEKGKITFRDGSEISGLIKISGKKVKFKKSKGEEKIKYTYKELQKVKFRFGDEYLYKLSGKSIFLIKRVIKGKLDLYSYEMQSPSLMMQGGMIQAGFVTGRGSSTVYMIGYNDSDFIEKLPKNPKKKKFRKVMMKYTSDCSELQNLIKDKKSVKENFAKDYSGFFQYQGSAVEKMVEYYNETCN